jgi:hypothetical protein
VSVVLLLEDESIVPNESKEITFREADSLLRSGTLQVTRIREIAAPSNGDGVYVMEVSYASMLVGSKLVVIS